MNVHLVIVHSVVLHFDNSVVEFFEMEILHNGFFGFDIPRANFFAVQSIILVTDFSVFTHPQSGFSKSLNEKFRSITQAKIGLTYKIRLLTISQLALVSYFTTSENFSLNSKFMQ